MGGHSVNLWLSAGSVQVKKANKDYTCGCTKMAREIQYCAVLTWKIFIKNIRKMHPIDRPSGRGMGCLLWIMHLIDSLPQFPQLFMQYLTILDHVITGLYRDQKPVRNISACQQWFYSAKCLWLGKNKQTFVRDHNKWFIGFIRIKIILAWCSSEIQGEN